VRSHHFIAKKSFTAFQRLDKIFFEEHQLKMADAAFMVEFNAAIAFSRGLNAKKGTDSLDLGVANFNWVSMY